MASVPTIVLPLKRPKECELEGALMLVLEQRVRMDSYAGVVPEAACHAAKQVHDQRAKLVSIEKLAPYTSEDAAASFLKYAASILRLENRFDNLGSELQLSFKWRDAFNPNKKCEQSDLQWERVGAYFAAAASHSYTAAQEQQRGNHRDAASLYQQAASCLNECFTLTKPAIWGLQPRWDPKLLTADVQLPMLEALRDLMLAQSQRTFYAKACTEGNSAALKMQLSAGAAKLFNDVLKRFQSNKDMEVAVTIDGGMFQKSDRSFLGRVECSALWSEALAQEHAAEKEFAEHKYGEQVYRLSQALLLARKAVAVAQTVGLPQGEYSEIARRVKSIEGAHAYAEKEARTVYAEQVPNSMPALEGKVLVKVKPLESIDLGQDAFAAILLPASVQAALSNHRKKVQVIIRDASSRTNADADEISGRLAKLQLPHELDAVTSADKHLPAETRAKVERAKQLGDANSLQSLRQQCEKEEELVHDPSELAQSILDNILTEDNAYVDKSSLRDPRGSLEGLPSSAPLAMCRSKLTNCKSQLMKAKEVTRELGSRLDSNLDDIMAISPSIDEIEAAMPHLDGTCLEQEPCVQDLRDLIAQLDRVKVDSAAALAASKETAELHERDLSIPDKIMSRPSDVTAEAFLQEYMQPFEEMQTSLHALHQRREGLMTSVTTEYEKFRAARGEASAFPERVSFFDRLNKGADQMLYLHQHLTEGLNFYKTIRKQIEDVNREALRIADSRSRERDKITRAAKFGASPSASAPPSIPPQPLQAAATPVAHLSQPPPQCPQAPYQDPTSRSWPGSQQQPVQAQPTQPVQSAYAQSYPAQAHPYRPQQQPQPQQPQATHPIARMACYSCRQQFGVPPNTSIAACPFCNTHNRVPGR